MGKFSGKQLFDLTMHMLSLRNDQIKKRPIELKIYCRSSKIGSSKVAEFMRHSADCGSSEVQIARLTARIAYLSAHLKQHNHDHSTKRGLTMMIGQRSGLLSYIRRTNRDKYLKVVPILDSKVKQNKNVR